MKEKNNKASIYRKRRGNPHGNAPDKYTKKERK